ncbi:MAG: hypothetical protein NHB15_11415 [Methanosarcina barkeri]|nr:hypothetical protein [Methanosarcina sp. ERenArc_MAG2]
MESDFWQKSKNLNKSEYLKNENIIKVVEAFLNISNANDARRIMEQHPELLSEEADSMLIDLCKTAPSEKVNKLILNRRNVLAYCREVGIDQAFKEISSLSNETSKDYHYLLMKLEEVNSLSRPQDMPKK